MGMNINKAGGDNQARRINFFKSFVSNFADRDYAPVTDPHIANLSRAPGTVDHLAVTNY